MVGTEDETGHHRTCSQGRRQGHKARAVRSLDAELSRNPKVTPDAGMKGGRAGPCTQPVCLLARAGVRQDAGD